MITLNAIFLGIAVITFAVLSAIRPDLTLLKRVLIATGLFLALSILTTIWIVRAAYQMPEHAEVIAPVPKN